MVHFQSVSVVVTLRRDVSDVSCFSRLGRSMSARRHNVGPRRSSGIDESRRKLLACFLRTTRHSRRSSSPHDYSKRGCDDLRKRLYNVLPVPESFYDKDALQLRPGCHAYLASPGSIAVYSLLLYALSGGAFAALFAYYSLPSQFLTESVVQSTSTRAGFDTCTPLQKDPVYNVDYTFDECLAKIVEPSASSVVNVGAATLGYTYKFYPFANGVSFIITDIIKLQSLAINGVSHGNIGLTCMVSGAQAAVECFTKILELYYGGKEGFCAFTKENAPFQCVRETPIEVTQRISLSYAGAVLVYSGLSIFLSSVLRYRRTRREKILAAVRAANVNNAPSA